MSTLSLPTRSVFRQLLREVKLQYTKPSGNALYVQELKSEFRKHRDETDPLVLLQLQRDAQDTLTFLQSSRKHKELLERYNPGLMEESQKIHLTAKRVGFELPKEYKPDVEGDAAGSLFEMAGKRRVEQAFHKTPKVEGDEGKKY